MIRLASVFDMEAIPKLFSIKFKITTSIDTAIGIIFLDFEFFLLDFFCHNAEFLALNYLCANDDISADASCLQITLRLQLCFNWRYL